MRKYPLVLGGEVEIFLKILLCLFSFIIQNSMILLKTKTKNNSLKLQFFSNLQNHPTFTSEERLVNLQRGRECFVGLSVLLVYA